MPPLGNLFAGGFSDITIYVRNLIEKGPQCYALSLGYITLAVNSRLHPPPAIPPGGIEAHDCTRYQADYGGRNGYITTFCHSDCSSVILLGLLHLTMRQVLVPQIFLTLGITQAVSEPISLELSHLFHPLLRSCSHLFPPPFIPSPSSTKCV